MGSKICGLDTWQRWQKAEKDLVEHIIVNTYKHIENLFAYFVLRGKYCKSQNC